MNQQQCTQSWDSIKDQIKHRWSDLTDYEIDSLKGNLDQLVGILQTSYGYAKEKAEDEYKEFKNSLNIVWDEMRSNKHFGIVAALSLLSLLATTGLIVSAIIRKKF